MLHCKCQRVHIFWESRNSLVLVAGDYWDSELLGHIKAVVCSDSMGTWLSKLHWQGRQAVDILVLLKRLLACVTFCFII